MEKKVERSEQSGFTATDSQKLRRQAETMTKGKKRLSQEDLEVMSLEEMRHALHELDVHQIELEIQNEELRRAQAELELVRARYFDLYDLAPVGYCTISQDGGILEANLTLATLLGTTRNALSGQKIESFIHHDDQDIFYLHRKLLLETGDPQEWELRMVKKDETIFWAHLVGTATQDAEGKPVYRVVINDITERKNTENLLRASEEKYRLITENVTDVISVYNIKKGQYTYISPSIFQLRGLTVKEAMQENNESSLTPESRISESEVLAETLQEFMQDPENSKNYISEIQQYCKNGDIIWVELSKKYRYNTEGEIEIVGLSRNVTERILAFADAYDAMIEDRTYREN
ncbi:PAS domain-containing protein [Acetobacterium bakii]|uniref:PAS domain-containing protein n=1 Tax=Acetobacterium bakii TaxID=52689 RepID=UPI000681F6C9|nr:PAS domain-containing protein [Acetobacterium bakii]